MHVLWKHHQDVSLIVLQFPNLQLAIFDTCWLIFFLKTLDIEFDIAAHISYYKGENLDFQYGVKIWDLESYDLQIVYMFLSNTL